MNVRWLAVCVVALSGCAVDDEVDSAVELEFDEDVSELDTRFDPQQPTAICKAPDPLYEEWSEIKTCQAPAPDRYRQGVDTLVAAGVRCTARDRATGACTALDETQATDVMEDARLSCRIIDPLCANGRFCNTRCCLKWPGLPQICSERIIFYPF